MPTTIPIADDLVTDRADMALSARQGKFLGDEVFGEKTAIDLSELTEQNCSLGNPNWYYSNGIGKHKAVAVSPGDKFLLKMAEYNGQTSGSATGWYVFVTSSYSPPYSNGNNIPKTGSDSRIGAPVGTDIELTAPSNAAYLVITTQDGAGVRPTWMLTKIEGEGLDEEIKSNYDLFRGIIGEGFFTESEPVDLSNLTTQNCSLGGSGKWYMSGYYGRHIAVPLEQGKTYRLRCTDQAHGFWGLVNSSYSPPYANNSDVPYVASQSDRYQIERDTNVDFAPPSDAAYLILTTVDGGGGKPTWSLAIIEEGAADRGTIEEELDRIEGIAEGADPKRDETFTSLPYSGERIRISMNNSIGFKNWNPMLSGQGMAIYGNLVVRMRATSASTVHYIYEITSAGLLNKVAEFTCTTCGHANALQFAPVLESGQTYPYLYVSDLDGSCIVLNIASDYTVTQVQKITVPSGWQSQIGDDGHIWTIIGGSDGSKIQFVKYRKVAVSEGATIALTASDALATMTVEDLFPSAQYTFQGSKFKFGKAWLPIGTSGTTKKRALLVYDLASQRTVANIDLTNMGNIEFEDMDFWDNAIILATWANTTNSTSYIMRF